LTQGTEIDLIGAPEAMSPDKQTLDDLRIDRAAPARGKAPVYLILLALVLALAAGAVIWWFNQPKPAVVRTITIHEASSGGSDRTLLNASGYVTARREATVASKVMGMVVEVLVEEGMKVQAGQVLARIDASNVERSLNLAEAQKDSAAKALNETKASLEQAERELRRSSKLAASNVTSQSELDRADAEAKTLRARLQRLEADVTVADRQVALWKQQLEDTIIRAPFSGIVTSKNAQPGEIISPMSAGGFTRTGICTIVDMTSLEIEVDVNESYINRVQAGQPVEATLDSYPDWHMPAKVIAIIPTADRQKATVKVRVGFEKLDPRILPHMSVKVAFQGATDTRAVARTLAIPKSAVRQREGRDVVWVIRNSRAERRAVTLGAVHGDEVEVTAGLSGGEKIMIEGGEDLTDGARVTEAKR
jgi:RND family efflux transporter MFP subunit